MKVSRFGCAGGPAPDFKYHCRAGGLSCVRWGFRHYKCPITVLFQDRTIDETSISIFPHKREH